jgi:hypothetical protein
MANDSIYAAVGGGQEVKVAGRGLVDLAIWPEENSITAHLVNLTSPMTMHGGYRETIPTGPYTVTLGAAARQVGAGDSPAGADGIVEGNLGNGRVTVPVPIELHEVVALDLA